VPDAAERLVNLALYLASSARPITAEQCRAADLGYPEGQDDAAFIRMFERDKDALRAAGLVIEVVADEEPEAYRLDAAATYARQIELTDEELSAVRAVAATLAGDPTFPFREDLALALGKIGVSGHAGPLATGALTANVSDELGHHVGVLAEAVRARKTVTFSYTNVAGTQRTRSVDPYGIFFREGLWYLTGRDRDADAIRTYAVARLRAVDMNPVRPRTPDFERPQGFDIREQERLPFQYGPTSVAAVIRFEPDVAWRAEGLIRGRGVVEPRADGSLLWKVDADLRRLASWIVDQGTGLHAEGPPELRAILVAGLQSVVVAHD
jgi:proteasome accessory factor B